MIRIVCLCLFFSLQLSAQKKLPGNGRVQRFSHFPSSQITPRDVDVWLPEGYPEFGPYAVIYFQDGQNLFDSTLAAEGIAWKADKTASALLRSKKIHQCILVGIHSSPEGAREYIPQSVYKAIPATLQQKISTEYNGEPLSDAYLLFLVKELKPFIDNSFYSIRTPEGTSIAGAGLGGLVALYALCEYPKVFGAAASMSTHWPISMKVNDARIPKAMKAYLNKKLPVDGMHRIYFDYGTLEGDKLYKPYQLDMDLLMKEKGHSKKNWVTKECSGSGHKPSDFQNRLPAVLKFLLPR
jgi:predicted alpha/beta superfamily hydrolase